ncbi:zinc-binding protein A33-like [Chiloscyllium plagiosum]|uniref:zinc-binding protein A33-like n=1 Tax=Chiloscyllium plagiosum TaxID=36176 RepID=UPI001CB84CEF|nr:zinc-binding protein A33-like [Chiloscyllium plagiosum]
MASRQQGESLTEGLICPICQDFFTDPVTLDCGLNFCHSCITQSWENQEINSCPECNQEFPQRNLKINQALTNLAKIAQKLSLKLQEKESMFHCEEHEKELKLFCETDKKLICVICRDSRKHGEHHFIPVKEAVEIYQDRVKSSLDSLTALELKQQQKQKISQIQEESSSLQTHVKSEFTKMHQILTEKEQSLLRDLREQEENILKTMEQNLCEFQENLNSIQKKFSRLEKQLEQKDRVLFLKEEVSRKTRISDEAVNDASLTDGVLSTEKFNSLPFPVWREMLDAIKPGKAQISSYVLIYILNFRLLCIQLPKAA